MMPPRPICTTYPTDNQHNPTAWASLLGCACSILEELKTRTELPGDDAYQAVAHLFVTLAKDHLKRLH